MTQRLLTDVSFASLDLEPAILRGIEDAGFEFCTPIQAQSLPAVLAGRDVGAQLPLLAARAAGVRELPRGAARGARARLRNLPAQRAPAQVTKEWDWGPVLAQSLVKYGARQEAV